MEIDSIYIYPIKGCRAIKLETAHLTPRGFEHDRRWMVIDAASGLAITQREVPSLALVDVAITKTGISVKENKLGSLNINYPTEKDIVPITLFGKSFYANATNTKADQYFSELSGRKLKLVYQGDHSRQVDPKWVPNFYDTSLSDGFPVLIVNQASLLNVQVRANAAIPMDRFRPNIIILGGEAWDEDTWGHVQIGKSELECVKPSTRCIVTTIDQQTGNRADNQPIQTLTKFRMIDDLGLKSVIFGQNAIAITLGTLNRGDEFKVLSRQNRPKFRPEKLIV